MLRLLEGWPDLRRPFMVIALHGWIDAGSSAQLAAAALRQGWNLRRIAVFDSDEFLDYQHRRPQIRLDEDGRRRVEWQEVELLVGDAGVRDVVLLTGPEPARSWQTFIGTVIDAASRTRVQEVYALGGLPSATPHTRPVLVAATVTSKELAGRFDALLGSYDGPTGLQTALQVAFGTSGIPAISLWAQVPHYLAAMLWPGGSIALLRGLGACTDTEPQFGELLAANEERLRQVDEAVKERPDVQSLVRALEDGGEAMEVPSGDQLADEIERFLRERQTGDGSPA
jgi:proteasome assembly chaperone (PAC2) family protein